MKLVKVSSIFASLRCALVSSVGEDEETMLQMQQRSTVDDENCASGNCHPTINDGNWNLVFRQTNGFWFNKGQWSLNADDPTKDDFSILDRLEKLRRNGAFEFRLVWPGSGLENQTWSQTSNPVTAKPKTVEGYEAISAPHSANHWKGLENNGGIQCLLDGSVDHGNWYYSVGSFQKWSTGIPGPATPVNKVELYAKAPTPDDLYPKPAVASCSWEDPDPDPKKGGHPRCKGGMKQPPLCWSDKYETMTVDEFKAVCEKLGSECLGIRTQIPTWSQGKVIYVGSKDFSSTKQTMEDLESAGFQANKCVLPDTDNNPDFCDSDNGNVHGRAEDGKTYVKRCD